MSANKLMKTLTNSATLTGFATGIRFAKRRTNDF